VVARPDATEPGTRHRCAASDDVRSRLTLWWVAGVDRRGLQGPSASFGDAALWILLCWVLMLVAAAHAARARPRSPNASRHGRLSRRPPFRRWPAPLPSSGSVPRDSLRCDDGARRTTVASAYLFCIGGQGRGGSVPARDWPAWSEPIPARRRPIRAGGGRQGNPARQGRWRVAVIAVGLGPALAVCGASVDCTAVGCVSVVTVDIGSLAPKAQPLSAGATVCPRRPPDPEGHLHQRREWHDVRSGTAHGPAARRWNEGARDSARKSGHKGAAGHLSRRDAGAVRAPWHDLRADLLWRAPVL